MGLFGKSAAERQLEEERETRAETDEAWSDLKQQLATTQANMTRMKLARTPEGMLKMADEAARQIEDVFAAGNTTRDQRLLNITHLIRRQIAVAVQGEALWSD